MIHLTQGTQWKSVKENFNSTIIPGLAPNKVIIEIIYILCLEYNAFFSRFF